MLKKLMKAVVVTATVMALGSTGAFAADGKAKIKEYVYDVESAETAFLHVTSSDGTKWDNLKSGILPFSAHMKIDTKWPGAVAKVGVVLGQCSGNDCKSFPILWSESVYKRDYNHQRNFSVPTSVRAHRQDLLRWSGSMPSKRATSILRRTAPRSGTSSRIACRRHSSPTRTRRGERSFPRQILTVSAILAKSTMRRPAISASTSSANRMSRVRRSVT